MNIKWTILPEDKIASDIVAEGHENGELRYTVQQYKVPRHDPKNIYTTPFSPIVYALIDERNHRGIRHYTTTIQEAIDLL